MKMDIFGSIFSSSCDSKESSVEYIEQKTKQCSTDNFVQETNFLDHDLQDKLQKTFYYGKLPLYDCLSHSATKFSVEEFSKYIDDEKKAEYLNDLNLENASKISRHACLSPYSLMVALIYVHRLQKYNNDFLRNVPPSHLFLASMMVASKFLYDEGLAEEVWNHEWASAAGIPLKEMNDIEIQFLNAMDWQVFSHKNDFYNMLEEVECKLALTEGLDRGWFSYTELSTLFSYSKFSLLQTLLDSIDTIPHILVLCFSAYVATICAMGVIYSIFGLALVPIASTLMVTVGNQLKSIGSAKESISASLLYSFNPLQTDSQEIMTYDIDNDTLLDLEVTVPKSELVEQNDDNIVDGPKNIIEKILSHNFWNARPFWVWFKRRLKPQAVNLRDDFLSYTHLPKLIDTNVTILTFSTTATFPQR